MSYKNPPKSSQFQKGQSGNPKGRPPKKAQRPASLTEDLMRELQDVVKVSKNGEVVCVTKQQALVTAVITKAINGSIGQQRLIVQLCSMLVGTTQDHTSTAEELEQFDETLLLELNKLGISFDGGHNDT